MGDDTLKVQRLELILIFCIVGLLACAGIIVFIIDHKADVAVITKGDTEFSRWAEDYLLDIKNADIEDILEPGKYFDEAKSIAVNPNLTESERLSWMDDLREASYEGAQHAIDMIISTLTELSVSERASFYREFFDWGWWPPD